MKNQAYKKSPKPYRYPLFIVAALGILSLSSVGAATTGSLDFRGGVQWSVISDDSGEYEAGYTFGSSFSLVPLGILGGGIGIDYLQRAATYSTVRSKVNYIDIPLFAILRLPLGIIELNIEPGLYYAIPLKDTFYDVGVADVKAEKFLGILGRVSALITVSDKIKFGLEAYGKVPLQDSTKDRILTGVVEGDKIYDFGFGGRISFGLL